MKGRSPHAKMRPFLVIFAILFVICHTFVATPKRLCTKAFSAMVTNKQIKLKIYMYNEGWRPVLTDGSPPYYFFTHCRHPVLTSSFTFGRARASSVLLSLNHDLLSIHNVQTLLKSSYMRWSQISDFDYYSEMIQIIMNKPYCNFEGQDQILRPFYVFLL